MIVTSPSTHATRLGQPVFAVTHESRVGPKVTHMVRLVLVADLQDNNPSGVTHSDWTRFDIANGADLLHALQAILEDREEDYLGMCGGY